MLLKTGNPTAFSPLVLEVTGDDLSSLDQEAGGHRIQRCPPNEKRGRIHTSSCTVAVLDSYSVVKETVPILPENEFHIEFYSGSGSGGQHRNKHQNCARVTHTRTQLVESRQGRSRKSNVRSAIEALSAAVHLQAQNERLSQVNQARAGQIGTGYRGDKRRTYVFRRDQVTDHISGKSAKCSQVMKGRFDLLWS